MNPAVAVGGDAVLDVGDGFTDGEAAFLSAGDRHFFAVDDKGGHG